MKNKLLFLLFLIIEIVFNVLNTLGLSGLVKEFPEWDKSIWGFTLLLFSAFPILMYIYLRLIYGSNKDKLKKGLTIIFFVNIITQVFNMLLVKNITFTILALINIYQVIFILLHLHLKLYIDVHPFDFKKSIFSQWTVKEIIFDYGYLILISIPLKFPNTYTIFITFILLALFLYMDFYTAKKKNVQEPNK